MRRLVDVLRQIERLEDLAEVLCVLVRCIVHMHVKIAADHDLTAVRCDNFKQLYQLLEKQFRDGITGRPVDDDVDD